MKRLTAEEGQELVRRYTAGETAKQAGEAVGLTEGVAVKRLRALGAHIRTKRERPDLRLADEAPTKKRIFELYEQGLTTKAIAAQAGVSSGFVSKMLRRDFGVAKRPPTKRHRLTQEQILEAHELYKQGEDYLGLGKRYGVSTSCISDALHTLPDFHPRVGWAKYRLQEWMDRKGRTWRFKSSWERKYAEYMDSGGLDWAYEPRSYPLKECVKYTPDFEVYGEGGVVLELVEVKGWLDERTENRLLEFRALHPGMVLKLVGIEELVLLGLIEAYYLGHSMKGRLDTLVQKMA